MTRARDLANIADGTFTATDLDLSGTLTVSGDATFDTNTLFVDVSENKVGIGTTSPSSTLHISSSTPKITLTDSGVDRTSEVYAASDNLVLAADTGNAGAASHIRFEVDTQEKMRIDSSGNLLVGTTETALYNNSTDDYGTRIYQGRMQLSSDGTLVYINRQNSDGDLIQFRKDGSTVGSIGTLSNIYTYIGTDDTTLLFAGNIDAVLPRGTAGAQRDAAIDLGNSSNRFKNLHLSGYASVNALASPDGTSIVFPTNAGNVGIGETSPSSNCRVHVKDADVQMELEGTQGANSSFIDFDGTNLQLSTTRDMKTGAFRNTGKSNATLTLTGASGGSTIRMYTAAADNTVATERARIDSSGKLFVGTSGVVVDLFNSSKIITNTSFGVNDGTNKGQYSVDRINFNKSFYYVLNQVSTGVVLTNGSTSWGAQSDETLKENISDIGPVLEKVTSYRCVNYSLKSTESSEADKVGFIAQDWQADFPNVVDADENGLLIMRYTETIPVLLKAIQEQQEIINDLRARVAQLEGA